MALPVVSFVIRMEWQHWRAYAPRLWILLLFVYTQIFIWLGRINIVVVGVHPPPDSRHAVYKLKQRGFMSFVESYPMHSQPCWSAMWNFQPSLQSRKHGNLQLSKAK